MLKRTISLFLCLIMVLSFVPVQAFSTENREELTDPMETIASIEENTAVTESTISAKDIPAPTEVAMEPHEKITVPTDAAIVPAPIENQGFPEYAIILPQGTEYSFSEDEKTIFFPALDQKIASGDTFVLYIGSFPAAYIAKNVSVEKDGVIVYVEKAPEEIYANVNFSAVLDVQDAIVSTDNAAGVSSAVVGDTIVITHSACNVTEEEKHTGKLSVTLSNFHIEQPAEGRPTLSVDYEFALEGEFKYEDDIELGQIRFLGIGTFDISFLMEVTAELKLSKTGKFIFYLDSDPEEESFIIEDDRPGIWNAKGSCELKLGLKMAVGVDFFVDDADIFTATGGVAGKLTTHDESVKDVVHTHTDFEYYWFFSFGLLDCKAGGKFPGDIERFCIHGCPTPARNPEFDFDMAVDSGGAFAVNKTTLEKLLENLCRMLSGSKTIDKYTELDKSCAVEAGSRLTIAENQTMIVHGNMEQRGVVELETGACLVVHGDYLQTAGTLILGEDSHLIIDGDYTIKNDPKTLLSGGEIKFEILLEEKTEVKDGNNENLPVKADGCHEVSTGISLATKLKLSPGSIVSVCGNLYQKGGDIEGGYYTKKCKIIVGEEGAESSGNYLQTAGSLKLDAAFDLLIYGEYCLSGGDVYLSHNINGPGARFEIAKDYFQSRDSSAVFYCDVAVGGNICLNGNSKVTHGGHTMTVAGDFSQLEESVFNAYNTATLYFWNGCDHFVYFENPENSNLGTIICENPVIDKIDAQYGVPVFYLGSDIETVGNLRLVNGADSFSGMWLQGNRLTVHGNLVQDGGNLGNPTGNGEDVQITVDGDYVIADGLLWADSGNISVGGDFRMQGYDAATNQVSYYEPSIGGFFAEDITMTVGGSVEVYCKIQNGNQGFCLRGPIEGAKLSIKGDLIQHNHEESDPYYNPFELGGDWELVFNGEGQPQNISFETAPTISSYLGYHPIVVNQNLKGLIWGDNTTKLKELLQKNNTAFDPVCNSSTGSHCFVDGKCVYCHKLKPIKGDVNCDWQFNEQDAVQLLWYTLFPELCPDNFQADFNNDGNMDEKDAEYLIWHTLFPTIYPLQ